MIGIAVFGARVARRGRRLCSARPSRSAPSRRWVDVARYVMPTDGLWHGAIYYLEPKSLPARDLVDEIGSRGSPFFSAVPPPWTYLLFVEVWLVAVLAAALVSFERREL